MIRYICIALICFVLGFSVAALLPDQESSLLTPEMLFAIRYQSSDYKLTALEQIKAGDIASAKGTLEASLIVDQGGMQACVTNSKLCSTTSKAAFETFMERKSAYLGP